MKCRRCREPAVIDIRRHNAAFCGDCFLHHCREQVRRTIDDFDMIEPGERVLVAVSGGKDSLGLWHLLRELGYDADGLYVGLGIGEYSDTSGQLRARLRGRSTAASCSRSTCRPTTASTCPTGRARPSARRAPRAGCRSGTSSTRPRSRHGYDVLATGHNLDDEAAVLFGNVLRWETGYLGRQHPVLARGARLRAQGQAARAAGRARARGVLRADRHRLHRRGVPDGRRATGTSGTRKCSTRSRSVRRAPRHRSCSASGSDAHERFAERRRARSATTSAPCTECGAPTPGDLCAFCRLRARATAHGTFPLTEVQLTEELR